MSLWIKICGNTSLDDAQIAAEAGANALGFVFAPSPRRVTAAEVAAIVPELPEAIEKIGVFVDASFEEIESTVHAARITGVQLHFKAPPELPAQLRARFGPRLSILRVMRFGADGFAEAEDADRDNVDAVLVDSFSANAVGGTGLTYDWSVAASLFDKARIRGRRYIAAGGLTPENAGEAILALRPAGVDVVSGVEAAPGHKDLQKVRAFIANARAAHRGRNSDPNRPLCASHKS
ncbi:MAG: phosphoribosylanthranilate isomerase [Terracidiphilus sp.]